jgi:hypothetical protein
VSRELFRLLPVVALAATAAPLAGLDLVVTRYDDPVPNGCFVGDCSLREAVVAANADDDADRILLSAGSYLLSIAGTGENAAAAGDLDVTEEVEIVGPGAPFTIVDGSGLDRVFEVGGVAGLTLRGLTVRGAAVSTMGILVQPGESLLVEDCEIRDNGGSGIQAGAGASVTVRRSTLADNAVNGFIQISPGVAELENVTLTENGSSELSIQSGPIVRCSHCTIQDLDDTDAEVTSTAPSVITMSNSVVLGNCSATNETLVSEGGNLESTGDSCQFDQASDQAPVEDAELGALGDRGGPTRTHLPEATSPAVDGGLDAACELPTDQRGAPRDATGCDSGAVEADEERPPTPLFADGFEQGHPGAWSDAEPEP